jgi:GntR family transcriptional regulator
VILDRSSAVPLYYQIHQYLLEQIRSGTLQPGQPIPSEQEIATSLGVSRMTARQAVKSLCDKGVAYSRRGLGTFVSRSKQEKTSTELLSFTEEMQARGCRTTSRVLSFEQVAVEAEVAQALHLGAKANVLRLKRVRSADSVPMSIEESFLPARLFPALLETFDPRKSLYQALAEHYGVRMAAADEMVEAALARAEEAHLLRIDKHSPVFLLTRISYAESGQPVEYVRSTYRGDRWKLVSRLIANHTGGSTAITRKPMVVSSKDKDKDVVLHRRRQNATGDGHIRKLPVIPKKKKEKP